MSRRSPGQKLINLPAQVAFVEAIDSHLAECGYSERAQFIRDAMAEKIEATLKKKVPKELTMPPGRVGKGGRQSNSSSAQKALAAAALARKKTQNRRPNDGA